MGFLEAVATPPLTIFILNITIRVSLGVDQLQEP